MRLHQLRNLGNRLNDAGLVVDEHDRDHRQPGRRVMSGKRSTKRIEIDDAGLRHRNFRRLFLREPTAFAHRRMLDGRTVKPADFKRRAPHPELGR